MEKIGIIDYGMGNLHSVENAIRHIGGECFISSDAGELSTADGLILPGVGAFPDAMKRIREAGLDNFIHNYVKEKPLLGICLGMQLLFNRSFEFGECEGLRLVGGDVVKMEPEGFKIPHMGWNGLDFPRKSRLTEGIAPKSQVYFVHSYMAVVKNRDDLIAVTEYGQQVTAAVQNGKIFGCQFHPEKSHDVGLKILENFRGIVHDNSSGN